MRDLSGGNRKLRPSYKLWLETKEGYAFGKGTFELLQKIQEVGTLSDAAKTLGMSYRYAWGIMKKAEKRIGKAVVKTYKGGARGGGAELTQIGKELLNEFLKYKRVFDDIYLDDLSWEGLYLKISARNRIIGRVASIEKGTVAAIIKIEIETPCIITSFITREAVEDLDIKEGDMVKAVIKSTEVMISKDKR